MRGEGEEWKVNLEGVEDEENETGNDELERKEDAFIEA